MKIVNCPRLAIAGAGSGVGKTSISLGLARALSRRGLRVQTFKVGPDFLDPTYLSLASGCMCYNLDTWMSGRQYVRGLFAREAADADVALIEGVMGMYDGASAHNSEGSTAQVAGILGAPVILVVDAWGVARSFAAIVKGFNIFEPGHPIAGVIANRCGSERHAAGLAEALESANLPPLVGAISRGALPELQSRHLGLVSADKRVLPDALVDQLADACERYLKLDELLRLARTAEGEVTGELEYPADAAPARAALGVRPRIGVASDQAFHFYYPDTLQELERRGATTVPFSPLSASDLPAGLDGLYLGGGYPEVHAQALAGNVAMLRSVRAFADAGRPVYAECGGLMYLSQWIERLDGQRFPMAGLLPFGTQMLPRLKTLGYVEVTLAHDTLWGRAGATLRGHEFHYSQIADPGSLPRSWRQSYQVRRRRGDQVSSEGFQCGNILASYIHLHLASHPAAIEHFLNICTEQAYVSQG